jgi:hypothetical protein
LLCLLLGGSGPAAAAPLPFDGILTVTVRFFRFPYVLVVPGTGVANFTPAPGDADHLSTLALNGGTFAVTTLAAQFPNPYPYTYGTGLPDVSFRGFSNQSALFAGLSGGPPGGGVMPLNGVVRLCDIGQFYPGNNPACTPSAGRIQDVPLSRVGLGGTQTVRGGLNLTLFHNPWTIGTTTENPPGFVHNAGSSGFGHDVGSGTFATPGGVTLRGYATPASDTAQPSARLQLVTATKVLTANPGYLPFFALTGVLQLHFVPEPGAFALLAAGGGALALLAWRRRTRR